MSETTIIQKDPLFKINITNLNIINEVIFENAENTENKCSICQGTLSFFSREDINNGKINNEVGLSIGECGHMFHNSCINKWSSHDKNVSEQVFCPVDKAPWKLKKQLSDKLSLASLIHPPPPPPRSLTSMSKIKPSFLNMLEMNKIKY